MALYQPLQGLTWKYEDNTGQLSIVATIQVELGTGEHINHSVSSNINNTFYISLFVVGGLNNSLLTIDIPYANITAGLSDVELVRQLIATIAPATIDTTVYKNSVIQGGTSNKTSKNSNITIE
jgi:hypothetical protein